MSTRHSPDKRSARRAVRRRRALPDADRPMARGLVADRIGRHAATLVGLSGRSGATTVALYLSLPDEPGTAPLRRVLRASGHRVLLPVLCEDRDLDWVVDDGTADDGTTGGTDVAARTPPGRRLGRDAVTSCDVVVVPALAVDRSGTRLGQGGGSYDRALARLAGPRPVPVVAVVHDEEVLAASTLPREAHDRPVTHALTPSGVVALPVTSPPGRAPRGTTPPPRPPAA